MHRHMTMQQKTSMNPMVRDAQANPTDGNSCCKASGKITPPKEPPAAAMPVAFPRFSRKKWLIAANAGVKMSDVPKPPSTPKTRKKCQYFVQLPSKKFDAHKRTLPARTSHFGPCASKTGPICKPQKNDRNTYMEKIQLMELSLYPASWCSAIYAW